MADGKRPFITDTWKEIQGILEEEFVSLEVTFLLSQAEVLRAAREQLRRMRNGETYLEQQPDGSFAPPTIEEVERRIQWLEGLIDATS